MTRLRLTRRRTAILVAVLLLLGVGTVVVVRSQPQCGDEWGAVVRGAADPVLRPVEDLRTGDPSYADYADLIGQAQGLGATFGALRSASPGDNSIWRNDTLMPVGDDVVVGSGTSLFDPEGEVRRVDLSSGDVGWRRTYWAQPLAGGLVGGAFVGLIRPPSVHSVLSAPVMTAFDPSDGRMIACATVGRDVQTADAYADERTHAVCRMGDDFLVVVPRETRHQDEDTHGTKASTSGTKLSLSRVVPATGATAWAVELDPDVVDNVGAIDVIDDVALLSTVDSTNSAVFMRLFQSGPGSPDADPKVVAYSTDDGHQLWAFHPTTSGTALSYATVVGTDPKTGIIVIDSGGRVEHDKYPYVLDRTLTAVDVSGKVLWSKAVTETGNPQPDFVTVLGSTVVVHSWAADDSRLFGWDITDGTQVWSDAGGGTPLRWADAVQVGGLWLVPTLFGIKVIDPATGLAGQYDLQGGVRQIAVNDKHLVLETFDGRLLVFDRRTPA